MNNQPVASDVPYSTKMARHSKTQLFSQLSCGKKPKNVFMNKQHDFVCRMVGGETSSKLFASPDWMLMGVYSKAIIRAHFYEDIDDFRNEYPLQASNNTGTI